MRALSLIALEGMPLVRSGDDIAAFISNALTRQDIALVENDVLVVAQKIVSKAQGRHVALREVTPSASAKALSAETGKDPRIVEVILSESTDVLRHRQDLIVVAHRQGFVMANAGIDQSNVEQDEEETVLLLPDNCDAAAEHLRGALEPRTGCALGVIIADSFGRAWRRGTIGTALGAAGLPALIDMRGTPDLFGRALRVTEIGFADEIAAAASLLMGQAAEAIPVVLVRGLSWSAPEAPAAALLRHPSDDLFR
ncbi:MAG: coenzyme F420-0:L-glutamate ligase [Methylobacteriaceae bacterium]|nr:coenzyme F420-0:L-glutamate ligase [Methylobacteriaceae bacterium]